MSATPGSQKQSPVKTGAQERLSGLSAYFISHPVATTLLMVGILFLGAVAYPLLPVSALPEIAFPTIQVAANLPVLTAHVVVEDSCFHDAHLPALLDELQQCLADEYDVEHSTFQFERAEHAGHEHPTHP